jgi:hypothetical protein
LPPNYTNNNAVLLDATSTDAALIPVAPASFSALSLLTAAAHGPVTNRCIVNHADGTLETNSFISPDWYDAAPPAFTANGRVSISTKLVDAVNAGSPRLFSADLPLADAASPVTNIVLTFIGGGYDAHAVVFAVSGAVGTSPRPTLSIAPGAGGKWVIHSTLPGQLQYTTALDGINTVWHDEGPIAATVTNTPSPAEPLKLYRVRVQ